MTVGEALNSMDGFKGTLGWNMDGQHSSYVVHVLNEDGIRVLYASSGPKETLQDFIVRVGHQLLSTPTGGVN